MWHVNQVGYHVSLCQVVDEELGVSPWDDLVIEVGVTFMGFQVGMYLRQKLNIHSRLDWCGRACKEARGEQEVELCL